MGSRATPDTQSVTVKVTTKTVDRIDALQSFALADGSLNVTRSHVIRSALGRGLASLERDAKKAARKAAQESL